MIVCDDKACFEKYYESDFKMLFNKGEKWNWHLKSGVDIYFSGFCYKILFD